MKIKIFVNITTPPKKMSSLSVENLTVNATDSSGALNATNSSFSNGLNVGGYVTSNISTPRTSLLDQQCSCCCYADSRPSDHFQKHIRYRPPQ